jgi:hypothetical protein
MRHFMLRFLTKACDLKMSQAINSSQAHSQAAEQFRLSWKAANSQRSRRVRMMSLPGHQSSGPVDDWRRSDRFDPS